MSIHGPNLETRQANRINGPVYWPAAEFSTIGPIVRIRQVREDGTRGEWETMALALDPTRYVTAIMSKGDVRL